MPIQTRCPSCAAAVPPTAAWCSLCHADLRPRPAPSVAAPSVTVVPAHASGAGQPDVTVAGRHAAESPVVASRAGGSGGRHAARGTASPSTASSTSSRGTSSRSTGGTATRTSPRATAPVTLEGLDLPADGEVSPEQVDELAEQMLARLAVTETRSDVIDPEALPGGKWGFAAGVMVALVVAFVVVSWLLVRLVNR